MRLPSPCLVVLVGPSGSGKSTWASQNFPAEAIVSSDALRGTVGEGVHDQRASKDAFEVLELIADRRLKRGLTTVIDSTALDGPRRRSYLEMARRHAVPCVAVAFDTDPAVARRRNKSRPPLVRVPAAVLRGQLRSYESVRVALESEGFAVMFSLDATTAADPSSVQLVPAAMWDAPAFAARQREDAMTLRFGLQIPNFTWAGGPAEMGTRLADIVEAAEEAGFTSIWVMDHFLQIPPVGPEWLDMLDSYTTLGYIAGRTETARLGVLVAGITYRNIAHVAKIVATLDVLSGGRAICGLGAAWFEREHRVYGWDFPPLSKRYALLEDALQLLPLMWGPGAPAFNGREISVPEAICYPRPIQEPRPPIMVGGSGEKRTLKLVARYADSCNLFGGPEVVRTKLDVLARHCEDAGRDMKEIEVTQLSTVLVGSSQDDLDAAVDRLAPASVSRERYARSVNAGTVEDHIGRFRQLAEAGVHTAIVNMPDLGGVEPVERFAEIIAAFGEPAR